jgi:hypothetical protein
MGTASCLDGSDSFGRKSFVSDQELLVFSGEDIVCYRGWLSVIEQSSEGVLEESRNGSQRRICERVQ